MTNSNKDNTRPLLPVGRVVMTANLQAKLREANPEFWEAELIGLIYRHASACSTIKKSHSKMSGLGLGPQLPIANSLQVATRW